MVVHGGVVDGQTRSHRVATTISSVNGVERSKRGLALAPHLLIIAINLSCLRMRSTFFRFFFLRRSIYSVSQGTSLKLPSVVSGRHVRDEKCNLYLSDREFNENVEKIFKLSCIRIEHVAEKK